MIRANRHEIGATAAIMIFRKAKAFVVEGHAPKLAWNGFFCRGCPSGQRAGTKQGAGLKPGLYNDMPDMVDP